MPQNTPPTMTSPTPSEAPAEGAKVTPLLRKPRSGSTRLQRLDRVGYNRPNSPDLIRRQIDDDARYVAVETQAHRALASLWEALSNWSTAVVALTASISAVSYFADNQDLTRTFAVITALVAAINAGFSPADRARTHRDAARAYGHLERPLRELLFKVDSYNTEEFVRDTRYDPAEERYYDASYWAVTGSSINDIEKRQVWEHYIETTKKIEATDDTAPPVGVSWKLITRMFRRYPEVAQPAVA